jgi:F-type H+-transporting ATPase subunit delta
MSMRGVSRASFADLSDRLASEDITSATVASRLGSELFSVVGLLDTEHGLRRALSDPGKPATEKGAVVADLLHGKITARAEGLVAAADNVLDDLEDDLFGFGRAVAAQPELRSVLADRSLPENGKQSLLDRLLASQVNKVTLALINQMVAHPRGRSLSAALDVCAGIAAEHRQQLIALVRSAVELSAAHRRRLAKALADAYGHAVHLNVVVDPSVVGGISVQIGDELIDGTAASRLAEVRRKLAG